MSKLEPFVDDDEDVANVVSLFAVDLPHPATVAFGLDAQFRPEADLMVGAYRTERGFRVRTHDKADERVRRLRLLGMLPVIGTVAKRETIEAGFYLNGFARLVRRELIILRRSRL